MNQDTFESSDIEKLAVMVGREFSSLRTELETRFDAVDARFETVDKQLESIDVRFESLETEMHNGFRSVNERIDKLRETQIPLVEQDELWQRIRRIEDKLGIPHELVRA